MSRYLLASLPLHDLLYVNDKHGKHVEVAALVQKFEELAYHPNDPF